MSDRLEISLDDGLVLVIAEEDTFATVSLCRGARAIVLVHMPKLRGSCRVSEGADGIWFGNTHIDIPWLQLLRVADFLWLPIPAAQETAGGEAA